MKDLKEATIVFVSWNIELVFTSVFEEIEEEPYISSNRALYAFNHLTLSTNCLPNSSRRAPRIRHLSVTKFS